MNLQASVRVPRRAKDGIDGKDGKDAVAPIIINGNWAFWDSELNEFVESEFSAIGDDGHSPEIRDGYWWEWNPAINDYQNTGVKAEGKDGEDGKPGIDGFSEVTLYKASRLSPSVLPSRTLLPKTDSLQEPYYSFMNYWSYGIPENRMISLEFDLGRKQYEANGFEFTCRDHGRNYERNDVRLKFTTKVKKQKVLILYTHSKSSSSYYSNRASLLLDGASKRTSTVNTIETLELEIENIGEQDRKSVV